MKKSSKQLLSDIGLVIAAAIWGSTFFIIKGSLDAIHPLMLVSYRFLIAAVLLFLIVTYQGKQPFHHFKKGLVLGILLWILYSTQTVGLGITTASNSGFITGLFVIFVPIISYLFFQKKIPAYGIASVIVSLIGLWFLTGGLAGANLGDILTLACAVAYSTHLLFADMYLNDSKAQIDPYILNFQQFLVVGILDFLISVLFRLPLGFSRINVAYMLLYLAIFPTVLALILQFIAQKYTTPLKVTFLISLEPVFAAVFAWTLGGEAFILSKAIGGILIVGAIFLNSFGEAGLHANHLT